MYFLNIRKITVKSKINMVASYDFTWLSIPCVQLGIYSNIQISINKIYIYMLNNHTPNTFQEMCSAVYCLLILRNFYSSQNWIRL